MAKKVISVKGHYDDEAEQILREVRAQAVVLMVLGGKKGSGFSVSGLESTSQESVISDLPRILRHMADEIQKDIDQRRNQ